jgi:hypothetical protein
VKDYGEECNREIFFVRQSLQELKRAAQMLPIITKELFGTINKLISTAQKVWILLFNA